jgi:N-methylhydantoinase A
MRIGIDIGGTFTDIVAVGPSGELRVHKLPSTPVNYGEAIVEGIGEVFSPSSGDKVKEVIHGTTVATNAILSGTGALTGLITTKGFRDVLEIGRLRMPRLYDLTWEKPKPLVPRYLRMEVDERIAADGTVEKALDEASVAAAIDRLKAEGVESVAVCLLNSYVNAEHERRIGELLRETGDWTVSLSYEILPEIREYERTSTTVVNAYVLPVVHTYLLGLQVELNRLGVEGPLRIMQSGGGITEAETATERPVQIIESGPAAGVVAAAAMGKRMGEGDLIAFDMGGTTAKASLVEKGQIPRAADYEVGGGISLSGRLMGGGGYPIRVPCIDLAEIGAGGGSLLRVDSGGVLQVGPESAGADPGPVCYGRGGTHSTLTDANLLLGYLSPQGLAGGTIALDMEGARRRFQEDIVSQMDLSVEDVALGAHQIAAARMVRAVRAVSSERGRDPTKFLLMAFGGSGPLHAVEMAKSLEIKRIVVPPSPGLFSAFGLLAAGLQYDLVRTCLKEIKSMKSDDFISAFDDMTEEIQAKLPGAQLELRADLRYTGQSYELGIPVSGTHWDNEKIGRLQDAFETEHERTYGHRAENDPVEVVTLRLRAFFAAPELPLQSPVSNKSATEIRSAYFGESQGWVQTRILGRADLGESPETGPLIVEDYDATTLVPPGASASLDSLGNILIDVG